ncbi:MAG: FmdB family zinc ribbon protein [Actinomycetota bacterium]
MPTYEYACTQCGQHVEVFQRLSEEPLTTCGACGGALRKVFHPAGIVFKGSGFYATDSRSKPKSGSSDGKRDEKKGQKKDQKKDPTTSSTSSDSSSTSSSSSSSSSGGSSSPASGGEKAS